MQTVLTVIMHILSVSCCCHRVSDLSGWKSISQLRSLRSKTKTPAGVGLVRVQLPTWHQATPQWGKHGTPRAARPHRTCFPAPCQAACLGCCAGSVCVTHHMHTCTAIIPRYTMFTHPVCIHCTYTHTPHAHRHRDPYHSSTSLIHAIGTCTACTQTHFLCSLPHCCASALLSLELEV